MAYPLLGHDGNFPTYFLDDAPLRNGDPIDLLHWAGWISGEFRWNGSTLDRPQFFTDAFTCEITPQHEVRRTPE